MFVERAGNSVLRGDFRALAPYRDGIVDLASQVLTFEASDIKLEPSGIANSESPPVPQILYPRHLGVEGLIAAHPGRMTYIPRTSYDLATAANGDVPVGDLRLSPFTRGIPHDIAKLVTPPPWAYGGAAFTQAGSTISGPDHVMSLMHGALV